MKNLEVTFVLVALALLAGSLSALPTLEKSKKSHLLNFFVKDSLTELEEFPLHGYAYRKHQQYRDQIWSDCSKYTSVYTHG